jgi:hypothetical protein
MPPQQENRIKTVAALFASLSLFAATRAHAAVAPAHAHLQRCAAGVVACPR